jgi:hypothetical protein
LIDVAGESRVRITIIEDVAARTNIARTRSEGLYLKEFSLPTPPLMPEERSHRRSKSQRSIIIDDAISIDIEAKRK